MRPLNRQGINLPNGALDNRLSHVDCEDSPPSASAGWTDIRLDTPTDHLTSNLRQVATHPHCSNIGPAPGGQLPPLIEISSPMQGDSNPVTEISQTTPLRGPTAKTMSKTVEVEIEVADRDIDLTSQGKSGLSDKSPQPLLSLAGGSSCSASSGEEIPSIPPIHSCQTPAQVGGSCENISQSIRSSSSASRSLLVIRRSAPSIGVSHSAEGCLESGKPAYLLTGTQPSHEAAPKIGGIGGIVESCQSSIPPMKLRDDLACLPELRHCTAHRIKRSPSLEQTFHPRPQLISSGGGSGRNSTTTDAVPVIRGVGRWSPGNLRNSLNPFEDQLVTASTPHRLGNGASNNGGGDKQQQQQAARSLFWGVSPGSLPNENDVVQENTSYAPEALRTSTISGTAYQTVTLTNNHQNCPLFVKQSTATTATCQLISTPPPSRRAREPKSSRTWDICVKGEPLRLLNVSRLGLLIPFCLYILACSLKGPDWRHISYRVSLQEHQWIHSEAVVSLSGIERIREIRKEGVASSHTVSELPLTFKHVRESSAVGGDLFCDAGAHQKYIEHAIGNLSSLGTFIEGSRDASREFRVAMYEAMYGPTYRDIDCRSLRSFDIGGKWIKVCAGVCIGLLVMEWCICLLYLVSKTREQEAIVAFRNARRLRDNENNDKNNNNNNNIMTTTTTVNEVDGRNEIYTYGRNDVEAACGVRTVSSESRTHGNENSSTSCWVLNRRCRWPENVVGSGWSIPLWWKPLGWLQKRLHAQPRRGSRGFYYCISFLEGTTTLLSVMQLLLLGVSAVIWTAGTQRPACLDGSVELRTCSLGSSYLLYIVAIICIAGSVYYHLINGRLLDSFYNLKDARREQRQHQHQQHSISRATIEVPVTSL